MPQASWDTVMRLTDELRAQRGIEAQPAEILAVVIESGLPYVTGVPPVEGDLQGWVARRVVLRRELVDRLAALGAAHGQTQHAAMTAAVLAGLAVAKPERQQNPFFAPPALQYVAFANPYYYGSR
jgi:hypothetical protein